MKNIQLLPTENRCGIFSVEFNGFDTISENMNIEIAIRNLVNSQIVYSATYSMNDIVSYGLHIHSSMLEEGKYELSTFIENKNYRVEFSIDKPSELGLLVKQSLKLNNTPLIFSCPCDSKFYPYEDQSLQPWFDRPNAASHLSELLESQAISYQEHDMIKNFIENGFMIIENAFEANFIDDINSEIDDAITNKLGGYEYGSSKRIEHLHLSYPNIKNIWLNTSAKKYLDLIFKNQARPCQTLTFVFGSQQDAHQDSIHLTPFPAGYMCGMWIALQDVNPDSGELIVYPGSHREPRFRMSEMNCSKVSGGDWSEFGKRVVPNWVEMSKKYSSITYQPKKGTVLIWHENLLHAGSVRKNTDLERRSIVIHYFAQGAVAYYDSTGLPGMAAPLSVF